MSTVPQPLAMRLSVAGLCLLVLLVSAMGYRLLRASLDTSGQGSFSNFGISLLCLVSRDFAKSVQKV